MPQPWVQTDPSTPFPFLSILMALALCASFSRFECDERPGSVCNDYFFSSSLFLLIPHGFFYLLFHALFLSRQSLSLHPLCEVEVAYFSLLVSSIASSESIGSGVMCPSFTSFFRVSAVHLVMYFQYPLAQYNAYLQISFIPP